MIREPSREALLNSLSQKFGTKSVPETLAAAYDWWFIPRNPRTRAAAAIAITEQTLQYETAGILPDWMCAVYAKLLRDEATPEGETLNVAAAINAVIEENPSVVAALGNPSLDWIETLPSLWDLVFFKIYGEFAQNVPGTPSHYAIGARDPRWETILHGKVDGSTSGMTYMRQMLDLKGKKL